MRASISIVIVASSCSVFAQETFQNLNFEEASPVPVAGGYSAASCLPGWQIFYGSTPVSVIQFYFNGDLSGTQVALCTGAPAIDGNYSVALVGGEVQNFGPGGGTTVEAATISQTGLIPAGTQSLLFKAAPQGTGQLTVDIGAQSISFTAVASGPNYTLYGANISAWAGQTAALTFSAPGPDPFLDIWELDDISFSPNAVVPEPSPLALTGIGGIVFALYRRFGPKQR